MKEYIMLLVLGLMTVSFGATCVPDVDSIFVEVTIRQHTGEGGFVELDTELLELHDYISLYNYTRVYFSSYNATNLCSERCKEDPTDFVPNFVIVGEVGGYFVEYSVNNLPEGTQSTKFSTEGRQISIVANNYDSIIACEEDDENYYCSDFTKYKHCSDTNPSYRCLKRYVYPEYEYYLDYQPDFCGLSIWGMYSQGCVEGTSYVYCENRKITNKTCIDNRWTYETVEDCEAIDRVCGTDGEGNPVCKSYQISESETCADGTARGLCTPNPPKYCNDLGVLVDAPRICGCPSNALYEAMTDTCQYFKCNDGTFVGACSETLPLYCSDDGTLIEMASVCGCPEGYEAIGETCSLIEEPTPEEIESPEPPPQNETIETEVEEVTPNETEEPVSPPVSEATEEPETPQPEEKTEGEAIPMELVYVGLIAILAVGVVYFYLKSAKKK